MKIANADKLIHHFESCVDVKLFTVPEIVTIIESFSMEIPEGTELIMPREKAQDMTLENLKLLFGKQKPGVTQKVGGDNWLTEVTESILSEEHISEVHDDD